MYNQSPSMNFSHEIHYPTTTPRKQQLQTTKQRNQHYPKYQPYYELSANLSKPYTNQIKSLTTLPTHSHLENESSHFKYITNLIKPSSNYSTIPISKKNYHTIYTNLQPDPPNNNNKTNIVNNYKLRKISGIDRKQGYLYQIPTQPSYHQYKNKQLSNNPQIVPSKFSNSHLYLHEQIRKLQSENTKLRQKLLNNQFKQRQYVQKINKLQKRCLKLQEITSKRKPLSKEENLFISVMKNTFMNCFGIDTLKQIWKKEKSILKDWMEFSFNNEDFNGVEKNKNENQRIDKPKNLINQLRYSVKQSGNNLCESEQEQNEVQIQIDQENLSIPKSSSKRAKITIKDEQQPDKYSDFT